MAIRRVTEAALEKQRQYIALNRPYMTGLTYFIRTFGCQLNDNDSEKMAALLKEMGMTPVDSPEASDLLIINTCSVRENASGRFFGNLGIARNIRKDRPSQITVVCGCMMKQDVYVDKVKKSYPFVDLMFGPSDIYRLPELLNRRISGTRRVYDITSDDLIVEDEAVQRERKFRALVSVMYGCNNFCTFCVVPHTRGRERSRLPREILKEMKTLAAEGFSEVMLLGQNVNSYGKDLIRIKANQIKHPEKITEDFPDLRNEEIYSFAELLEKIAQESGLKRIRFMTSHPRDISSKLLDVIAANKEIERHLHLPLQSGSNPILKAMNRHYTVEKYRATIEEAKQKIEGLSLSTDIIVGFPGETEEDFQQTLDCVAEFAYDSAFTFMYSPRPGTKAAKEEQVPNEVVSERFQRLTALQNDLCLKANEARVGKVYEVLIEGLSQHSRQRFCGRASDNHLINFTIDPEQLPGRYRDLDPDEMGSLLEGEFAQVYIDEAKTFSLLGHLESFNNPDFQV